MRVLLSVVFGLFFLSVESWAQLVIEVVALPAFLPGSDAVFIAGEFNNWNPGDPAYKLKKTANGHYTITLPATLKQFEYKFTQGSWMTVEGNAKGGNRPNRFYDAATEPNPNHVRVVIAGWEQKPAYRFIITSIPANTPHDANIYITGNFNKWDPGDESLELQRQPDGTYQVTVSTDLERLEYKFTRGNWESIESWESGKARPNRVIFRHDNIDNKAIEVTIQNWEDLTGTFTFYSIYDLLLLFSAFQGLLLIITIPTIQNYNRSANNWLVILLGMASVMLLIRTVSTYRDVAQTYTRLLLVPDFIIFTYAPLFYIYIRKLLFNEGRLRSNWYLHFIPAAVQFFAYLPFFLMESKLFQLKIVNHDWDVQTLFYASGLLGLLFNAGYWLICRRTIQEYKARYQTSISYEQNLQYFNTVLIIQAVCLVLWLFTFILVSLEKFFGFDIAMIAERSVDIIWLAFSTITYFLGYFAIHQPEIFKLRSLQPVKLFNQPEPSPVLEPAPDEPLASTEVQPEERSLGEDLLPLKQQVELYMKRYKPYTNPSLTINEMANRLKLQPHVLSKVINEGFQKNFFDFINHYRVEELKKRMEDPRYKNYTLLSQAFDVGFNSKTSFNRAFKKITNQTPSEYFSATQADIEAV
ncbi:hypothetical protein GCM10023189_47920 [Nibrella saemangeumensis]|uniref:Helix-turn-helix domain-containing protein n=1 Tax=Nibrella saemangeumensis TaxID=1084526 RepID=A0ABP8NIC4_9BACT